MVTKVSVFAMLQVYVYIHNHNSLLLISVCRCLCIVYKMFVVKGNNVSKIHVTEVHRCKIMVRHTVHLQVLIILCVHWSFLNTSSTMYMYL